MAILKMPIANQDELISKREIQFDALFDAEIKDISNISECLGPSSDAFMNKVKKTSVNVPEIGIAKLTNVSIDQLGFPSIAGQKVISKRQFGHSVVELSSRLPLLEPTMRVQKAVSLVRPGDHIYGHWLIDILPRLWLLSLTDSIQDNAFIVSNKIPSYVENFFSLFKINGEQIIRIDTNKDCVSCETLLVPTNLRYDQVMHSAIAAYSDFMKNNMGISQNISRKKKIFVTRSKWKSKAGNLRLLLNETEIEEYLKNKGFEIISPEKLSFGEQCSIFHQANAIAGGDGSGLHNSIFSADGTHVTIFRGTKNHSLIQASLCQEKKQTCSIVFGSTPSDINVTRESPFEIDVNILRKLSI